MTALCQCGCGLPAPLAKYSVARRGWVKGQPVRFIVGHQGRKKNCYQIDPVTGCWNWLLSTDKDGYGQVTVKRKQQHAYTYYYIERFGRIPDGLVLDHLCRNRKCVNPDHLEAVTPTENMRRGCQTRLSLRSAEIIRQKVSMGYKQLEVAKEFGVSQSLISRVVTGERWVS